MLVGLNGPLVGDTVEKPGVSGTIGEYLRRFLGTLLLGEPERADDAPV